MFFEKSPIMSSQRAKASWNFRQKAQVGIEQRPVFGSPNVRVHRPLRPPFRSEGPACGRPASTALHRSGRGVLPSSHGVGPKTGRTGLMYQSHGPNPKSV